MQQQILEEIGLSKNEAKVYLSLLKLGEANVPAVCLDTLVNKRNIYDIIPKLLKRGIIFQIADSRDNRYGAVDPDSLVDMIKEKESKLNGILPGLKKIYKQKTKNEEVYIYRGVEGFKNYLRDILLLGEDVYFIGAKGGWFDPGLTEFIDGFLSEAKKKKIKYNHIFDHEVKAIASEIPAVLGKPYKFLPKKYSTTGAIDIFGDRVVTFSGLGVKNLNEDVTLFVIVNRELADCYRTWFRFMWDSI